MAKKLSSVPVAKRFDVRVMWAEGMCPSAFPFGPDAQGTVFLSKGATTFVKWDGSNYPHPIATVALMAI